MLMQEPRALSDAPRSEVLPPLQRGRRGIVEHICDLVAERVPVVDLRNGRHA